MFTYFDLLYHLYHGTPQKSMILAVLLQENGRNCYNNCSNVITVQAILLNKPL